MRAGHGRGDRRTKEAATLTNVNRLINRAARVANALYRGVAAMSEGWRGEGRARAAAAAGLTLPKGLEQSGAHRRSASYNVIHARRFRLLSPISSYRQAIGFPGEVRWGGVGLLNSRERRPGLRYWAR